VLASGELRNRPIARREFAVVTAANSSLAGHGPSVAAAV
jgi:hypothetical protein